MEPFVVFGIWWFPDQKDLQFEAKLDYGSPQGAMLTPTSDRFMQIFLELYKQRKGNSFTANLGRTHEVPLLLGVAGGRQFSLMNCNLHGFGAQIGLILEGAHFDKAEDATFPAYSLSFSGLDEWGASGRLKGAFEQHENGKTHFDLSYEMPPSPSESLKIELENAYVEISHSITFPASIRNRATLTEGTEFRVVPKPGMTISAVDLVTIYANLLRNFLMLAAWNYIIPLYARAWNDKNDISKGQVSLYWVGKGMGLAVPQPTNDWLFTMLDLGNSLEAVLQKWERKNEVFQPFIRNYFAHRYIPETFLEVQFLTYMQALEGYHKKLNPSKKKIDLKVRVIALLKPLKNYSAITKIIGTNPDAFAKPLIKVRNELTHEADLKISPDDLARNCQKLELIILMVLYHALGFPDSLIEEISTQNSGFQTRMH